MIPKMIFKYIIWKKFFNKIGKKILTKIDKQFALYIFHTEYPILFHNISHF